MADSNLYGTLADGRKLPLLGLGTWQSKPEEVQNAVKSAIDCGVRHIDVAYIYRNEKDVGEAVRAKIADGTVKREDVVISAKCWITCTHPDDVEANCRESLNDLGMDYIDLYLIHWPFTLSKEHGLFPIGKDGFFVGNENVDFVDTWRAMESLVDKGLVRSIGVANFNQGQVQRILDLPPKHPVTNLQVESHPYMAQTELLSFCQKNGITMTAYSPLGSPERLGKRQPDDPVLLEDPVVAEIAKKRGVTPAQVALRFQLQRGVAAIPKSVSPTRIKENFETLNFKLTDQEFAQLQGLNKDHRLIYFHWAERFKTYPFTNN